MRLFTKPFLSLFLVALFAASLQGQNVLSLDGHIQRHQIAPGSSNQLVQFENLIAGETYSIIAAGEAGSGICNPALNLEGMDAPEAEIDPEAHSITFTATSKTILVALDFPCDWDEANPPQHFLTIQCQSCKKKDLQEFINTQSEMATLTVTGGASADQLVRDVIVGGNCFDITNVTFSGNPGQIGQFANGLTNIGFDVGAIIATGDISVAPGPNDQDNASAGYGTSTPDSDLQQMSNGGSTFDMANIEFDFTPTQTPLTFQYVFASEEYCEYVGSQFNDAFGFFISGPGIAGPFGGADNIAVLPGGTFVTINNVNHLSNTGFYTNNTGAGGILCGQNPSFLPGVNEVQFDGYTKKMVAIANVIPCETYHIKLKIADVGDGIYDSAVFLQAGSFNGGGNASVDFIVNGDPFIDVTYEDCGTVELVFSRVGGNINVPLAVQYTISGTATPGADYTPIPPVVIIPAGQTSVTLNINIINDLILEGAETVIITLNSPCSCLEPQEILTINDLPLLEAMADTVTICGSGVGTLTANPIGGVGPYTYQWSTGSTDPSMTAFVGNSTNFRVTITDDCGKTSVATGRIIVSPPPNAFLLPPAPQLCPGQSAMVTINFNGTGPFEVSYLFNGDSYTLGGIYDDPFQWEINEPGLYQLQGVVDGDGCPGPGSGVLLVTQSDIDLTGVATDIDCNGGNNGSINTTVVGGQGPFNYTWNGPVGIPNIPDPTNLPAGDYAVTVTDGFGCTDTLSFVLEAPSAMATEFVETTIADCYDPNGGSIDLDVSGGNPAYTFAWSNGATDEDPSGLPAGVYTVTVTDQNNCITQDSVEILGNFDLPDAVATAPGPIDCNSPNIVLDGTGSSTGSNFSYLWNSAPGNIISGENTLNPIVDLGGNYIITVLDSLNGCTQSDTVVVIQDNALPDADAGPQQTITCINGTPTLDGTGSSQGVDFTYLWTAGNGGSILSGDSTLNPVVDATGTYVIEVTNNTTGCVQTDTVEVDLNLDAPTASAVNPPLLNCTLSSVTLDGSPSTPNGQLDFAWTTINGNIQSGAFTPNPVVVEAGDYTLIVTNVNNGCMDTTQVTVFPDNSIPTTITTFDDTLSCAITVTGVDGAGSSTGSNITYLWTTQDGNIVSNPNQISALVDAPGTYTLIITNTDNSCTSSADVTVPQDIALPLADAGAELVMNCLTPTLDLDGTGSSTGSEFGYTWSATNGGNILSGSNGLNPVIDAPGTYTIEVIDNSNGCISTSSVDVLDDTTPPVISVAAPETLNCIAAQIDLDAAGTSTGPNFVYSWTGPGILSGDSTLNPSVELPGNYSILVTNADNGCTSTQTVTVSQDIAPPPADAGPDDILNCTSPQLTLGGSGNPSGSQYSFAWTGPGFLSGANTANPAIDQNGAYNLVVTNTDNGCTSTDDVLIDMDFVNPQANAGPTFELTCVQNTFTLQATGDAGPNYTYQWSSQNGQFGSATNILTPIVTAPGDYTLLITNSNNGCTATTSVNITQSADIPAVEAGNPGLLTCAITSIQLDGTGTATGPDFSYTWTTTSGNIVSGGNSLSPVINQPGTYVLEVFNATNNCSDIDTVVVAQDILAPPIDAGSTATVSCGAPSLNLEGIVNTAGVFTYSWTASNGGNILSGNNTLTPLIDAAGTYSLLVTNTQNGCTSTDDVLIDDNFVDPVAAIANPDVLTCSLTQFALDASGSSSGNMSYAWTASGGGNIVDENNPLAPVINEPGIYQILVTDQDNGCTAVQSIEVGEDVQNPTANAGANDLLTCAITSLQLDGSGSSQNGNFTYAWDGPGLVSGSTSLSPTINQDGTYSIVVTNQDNGCTSTDFVVVNSDTQNPDVAIATPDVLTCALPIVLIDGSGSQAGANIFYEWTASPGNILSGANSSQASVNEPGVYTIVVTNNTNGCSSEATINVDQDIAFPTAEAGPGFFLTCATNQVNLDGSGSSGNNFSYSWTTQDGQILNGATSLNPLVDEAGIYTLVITNTTNGCTATDAVLVDMETNIPTNLDVQLEPPSCTDDDGLITFTAIDGGVGPFVYSIDGGTTSFTEDAFPDITPGNYTLWIQDANGCEYQEPLIVPMAPDPQIEIIPEVNIILGDEVQLNALLPPGYPLALVDTIIWEPTDGLTFSGTDVFSLLRPIASPYRSTEYTVTLISGEGCIAEDRIIVRVDTEPHVYIPNAFSPWNADGQNDIVYIFADGYQVTGIRSFKIFDRWGDQVFEDYNFQPNDPTHGWDGVHKGELMNPAVFVYVAEVEMIDGRIILFKGDITLVR
ncbi:MAG: choice-of-anchor L domain-containing protein [Saprospiraceae bacterium]